MGGYAKDICVVGGAGHVGLPLALAFAAADRNVIIYDLDTATMDVISNGTMPLVEHGAEPLLEQALREDRLTFTAEPQQIQAGRIRHRCHRHAG